MSHADILAVALATAVLLYAISWHAVRSLAWYWKLAARVALLAVFFAPVAWLRFGETISSQKSASAPPRPDIAMAPPPAPVRLPPPPRATAPPPSQPGAPAPEPTMPSSSRGSAPPETTAETARRPAPPPVAASRSIPRQQADVPPPVKDGDSSALWDVVPVFYGTDRKRGADARRLTYVADRAGRLELGRADVTVPKSHQVPNIERPFAIRVPFTQVTIYEAAEDPSKHFTLRDIKSLTKEQFLDDVRARLATSDTFKNRAVVFVHGYNTDFEFAIYRTAQMAYDLKFDGAPFLYSWPSASGITGYINDRDNAEQAEPHLRAFLEMVVHETGATNVSVIAHSMGNLPLLRVLRDIGPSLINDAKLDQVILAAPDVDRTVFEQLTADLTKFGKGVTMYASSKDRALTAARLITGGVPRAGDVSSDGPLIIARIDTIDVSSTTMNALTLGHSLYAERDTLIADIAALLQTGMRPPDARMSRFERVATPRGDYWRVP